LPRLQKMLSEFLKDLRKWDGAMGLSVIILAVSLIWTGCSEKSPRNEVTLKFSTWGSAEERVVIKGLVSEFEKTHPGVHVSLMHIPENYFQKLHILIAGDLTPDVMFLNSLSFPVYAENKILQPLDSALAKPQSTISRNMFYEPALEAMSWEGQLYAVPRDVSNLVMFYNRDLFRQAGLAEPTANWTLETMADMAGKLTKDTDGDGKLDQFGLSFAGKQAILWLPYLWSQGGDLFNADFTQFVLTDPQAVKALQFYADLRNKTHVAPTLKDSGNASMSQLFLQGKLAMMLNGRWSVPVLRQQATFHWDVAPFPEGENGSVVGIDASGYAISAKTAHPKESLELVQFLSSREAQAAFCKSGLIVPARRDVAESSDFLSAPPAHGHYFIDVIARGYPTHTPVRWNEISEELSVALEPVWEGNQSAQDAIESVAPKIRKLLP
jgi:multiple sugar transport system substrate-binding protein